MATTTGYIPKGTIIKKDRKPKKYKLRFIEKYIKSKMIEFGFYIKKTQ